MSLRQPLAALTVAAIVLSLAACSPSHRIPAPPAPPQPLVYAHVVAPPPVATTVWTSAVDLPEKPTFSQPISLSEKAESKKGSPNGDKSTDDVLLSPCGLIITLHHELSPDVGATVSAFDPMALTIRWTLDLSRTIEHVTTDVGFSLSGCTIVLTTGPRDNPSSLAIDAQDGTVQGVVTGADQCAAVGDVIACASELGSSGQTRLRVWEPNSFGEKPLWQADTPFDSQIQTLGGLILVDDEYVDPATGAHVTPNDQRYPSDTTYGVDYLAAVLPDGSPSGQVLRLDNIVKRQAGGLFGSGDDISQDTCQVTLWNLREQAPSWPRSVPLKPCASTNTVDFRALITGRTLIVTAPFSATWGIDLDSGQVLWTRPGTFGNFPRWRPEVSRLDDPAGSTADYLFFGSVESLSGGSPTIKVSSLIDVRTGQDVISDNGLAALGANWRTYTSPTLVPTVSKTQLQLLSDHHYSAYSLPYHSDDKPLWTAALDVDAPSFWTATINGRMFIFSESGDDAQILAVR